MLAEAPAGLGDFELGVSDFVALLNQTLEFAYPSVMINGELANFRVSKNKWVYFDLKDELASVRFFGTVYQLPGPLEDGMMLKVRGAPRLHPLYGFSVNVLSIQPAGEGSIKKAAELLKAKLLAEGLFDEARKRALPYPPERIGLIASKESAAYADFIKIINARWRGLEIQLADVQVQGEAAPEQIIQAVERFNQLPSPPEVLVITRGGGSAEDLQAFNAEGVVRAVAASRVPTLVAIGHEVDISLAELAADKRASTPSNAAEILVPDRRHVASSLEESKARLVHLARANLRVEASRLHQNQITISQLISQVVRQRRQTLAGQAQLLGALSPQSTLRRGYAVVRKNGQAVRGRADIAIGDIVNVELVDARAEAAVNKIEGK